MFIHPSYMLEALQALGVLKWKTGFIRNGKYSTVEACSGSGGALLSVLPQYLLTLLTLLPSMASSPTTADGEHDGFVHHIAVKLSREMNAINPNDLLARRVIDIASSNSLAGFITGACPISS